MTTLTFDELTIRSGHLGGEGNLPSILPVINVQTEKSTRLDEDDEIFFDIGKIRSIFPYNQQDLYDRALEPRAFHAAILENEFLRAVFLPELGGRLWSLFDKKAGRELLYVNDAVRYCNLALRNAWFSGGVEWNIGMIGHSPFTCEPLFTARLEAEDGTPILRMYEYERLRGVTYQMDFSLPEGSPLLLCRMRITNLQNKTIPMYWWSNIAVPESPDRRIVVPADESYFSFWNVVAKTPIPMRAGKDVSYPVNTECSMDYFYRIPEENRKYIACLDKDGYGLVQTSTRRLKGRKLFVWGQSEGGHTWQRFLTDKAGDYSEIQAGLGHTQYECLPMPPCSVWEWVEGYGALSADSAKVHGDWADARREVEARLDGCMTAAQLEDYLIKSRADFVHKKGTLIERGSGFGALENQRRKRAGERLLPEHLDFGDPGDAQRHWTELLETGRLPCPAHNEVPPSYLSDDAWFALVRQARKQDPANWYAAYMEGLFYMSRSAYTEAEACFRASLDREPSCWNLYALAVCRYAQGDAEGGVPYILDAMDRHPDDVSLARDGFRFLQECGRNDAIVERYAAMNPELQQDGKLKFYLASAYAHLGELDKAEEILYENGCLVVPIIREGELSLTSLWFYIEEQKHKNRGEPFDENYSTVGGTSGKGITVWANIGRDQIQVIKNMVVDQFTPSTGIDVTLSVVQTGFIEATLADRGPDVAIGMARGQPINLACRNALLDFDAYEGFDAMKSRFADTAFVPYQYQGKTYAIPCTQTFYMLFYRKDILSQMGIAVPKTWNDVMETVPKLQRSHMTIGLPYAVISAATAVDNGLGAKDLFATLLLQNGGTFYTDDYTKTRLDSEASMSAFKTWSDFYTKYGFDLVYDFYTRFSTGEMPIGIASYEMFNTLSVAAQEIRGLWEMAPIPGTIREDGSIDTSEAGAGSAAVIFKKTDSPESCYQFVDWWTSDKTQTDFCTSVENILGPGGRYATANLSAFAEQSWSDTELAMLTAQRQNVIELPEIPGSYYVSRSIDNAFRAVLYDKKNPRETFEKENRNINQEITRKRRELGLIN